MRSTLMGNDTGIPTTLTPQDIALLQDVSKATLYADIKHVLTLKTTSENQPNDGNLRREFVRYWQDLHHDGIVPQSPDRPRIIRLTAL
jgi:hypothetical protein